MSHKQHTLIITPVRLLQSESYTFHDFECPQCSGRGGIDCSGWSAKFKKNLDDPDWEWCKRCNGKGKLTAKVSIEWVEAE